MVNQLLQPITKPIMAISDLVFGNINAFTTNVSDRMTKNNRSKMQHITDMITTPSNDEFYIKAEGVYKIFGDDPDSAMERIKQGVAKQTLLEEDDHVLGIDNVDLNVRCGEIHVVMGLSGSGKSTLIRHLNRLIDPTAGSITINGQDILAYDEDTLQCFRQTQISMVFQRFGLMPHETIMDNVCYGLKVANFTKSESTPRAQRWIDRVGLSGFENHLPHQLSGGMQQRVGLARALTTDSPILLMDEAFSALDPLIRHDMQTLLLDLQKELKKTIVFITHDLDESLRLADQMTILKDGRVVQAGDPRDIIMNPADKYVADFVREVNRARVLRACWVMKKATAKTADKKSKMQIDYMDNLEKALKIMDGDTKAIIDVTKDGKVVGSLTTSEVLNAIKPTE